MDHHLLTEKRNRVVTAKTGVENGTAEPDSDCDDWIFLTNFIVHLEAEVDAGPQSGYICQVV